MPLQAKIADKLAIIRNMRSLATDTHMPEELLSGFPFGPSGGPASLRPGVRPTFGSVVSKLRPAQRHEPAAVRHAGHGTDAARLPAAASWNRPSWASPTSHSIPARRRIANLGLADGMTLDRLADRRQLLDAFDDLRRDLETLAGNLAGMDAFTAQALEIDHSPRRPRRLRRGQGAGQGPRTIRHADRFLQARRLVEAGVSVVTRAAPPATGTRTRTTSAAAASAAPARPGHLRPGDRPARPRPGPGRGGRGLGRVRPDAADQRATPAGTTGRRPLRPGGRRRLQDGPGDRRHDGPGGAAGRQAYIPQNVLATLYQEVFGIDPATTLPDHTRPAGLPAGRAGDIKGSSPSEDHGQAAPPAEEGGAKCGKRCQRGVRFR